MTLITGGARAGKSRFAQERALALFGPRVSVIATAEPNDEEMRLRIARHKAERPPSWETLEEALEVGGAFSKAKNDAVLLDCATLWVANLMGAGRKVGAAVEDLLARFHSGGRRLFVVSNEVGLGLVPEHPLARSYRDQLGMVNQMLAGEASEVWFVVSGLPLRIKGG